jgi:hypothetical protein
VAGEGTQGGLGEKDCHLMVGRVGEWGGGHRVWRAGFLACLAEVGGKVMGMSIMSSSPKVPKTKTVLLNVQSREKP